MAAAEHGQAGADPDNSGSREVSRTTLTPGITLPRFYFSSKDPQKHIDYPHEDRCFIIRGSVVVPLRGQGAPVPCPHTQGCGHLEAGVPRNGGSSVPPPLGHSRWGWAASRRVLGPHSTLRLAPQVICASTGRAAGAGAPRCSARAGPGRGSAPAPSGTTAQRGDRTQPQRIFLPRVLGDRDGETVATGTRSPPPPPGPPTPPAKPSRLSHWPL